MALILDPGAPGGPSPYALAFAALEQARAEGATVAWHPEAQSFRLTEASPALVERVRALSGLATYEATADAIEQWKSLAAALPKAFRVTHDPKAGLVRVVQLQAPRRLALERMVRTPERTAREMLTLGATTLRELPMPWSLYLERRAPSEAETRLWGAKKALWTVTTSSVAYRKAQEGGAACFVARELEAMALAVEVERAFPRDLDQWMASKLRGDWRLTHQLSGALDVRGVTEAMRASLELGSVLDALDSDLLRAELHEKKGG